MNNTTPASAPVPARPRPGDAESGLTLVEVIVAVCVLVLGLFGLIQAMVTSYRLEQSARERRIALTFVTSQLETIRGLDFSDLSAAPPSGYLIGTAWPSNTGYRKDLDGDGDVDLFARYFSSKSTDTYGTVSLYDSLLNGLRHRTGYLYCAEVVFQDPDAASGLSDGDGYWVTVRVLWAGAAGDSKLEITSFVADRG